jgi:hypothetical protein
MKGVSMGGDHTTVPAGCHGPMHRRIGKLGRRAAGRRSTFGDAADHNGLRAPHSFDGRRRSCARAWLWPSRRIPRAEKEHSPMRTITILPIAAAALAAGAIGAWSLGLASPQAVVADFKEAAAVCGPAVVSPATEPRARKIGKPRSILMAAHRYRAETCSGDYVCGADGAWEVVAVPAALPAMRQ